MKSFGSILMVLATTSALLAQEAPNTPSKTAIVPPIISPAPVPTPIKAPIYPLTPQSANSSDGRHSSSRSGEAFGRWLDLSDDQKKLKPFNEESELKERELFAGTKQD